MAKPKVDTTLLERGVKEFKEHLAKADELSDEDYIIEMNRAAGLALGIASEATLLVGDIQVALQKSQSQGLAGPKFDLAKLFGGLKGSEGSN